MILLNFPNSFKVEKPLELFSKKRDITKIEGVRVGGGWVKPEGKSFDRT